MKSQICLSGAPDRLARLEDKVLAHSLVTVLVVAPPANQLDRTSVAQLRKSADRHDVAFLVADDLELLDEAMADGIEIDWDRETYLAARERIGAGRSIGCRVGLSRHHAMEAAEAGADYVHFCGTEPAPVEPMTIIELVQWWEPIFEIPCMAWAGEDAREFAMLAQVGADFIALDADLAADEVWALLNMQGSDRDAAP